MSFLRFQVDLPDGYFYISQSKATGWTHVVMNYIGPKNGQGIRMHVNGADVVSDTNKTAQSLTTGDGSIVVGRLFTDSNSYYSSVDVDELIYFNAALTSDDVQSIYNSA